MTGNNARVCPESVNPGGVCLWKYYNKGVDVVTNPSWGTKRNCPSCGAHFYDLNKVPSTCPKCEHAFDPNSQTKARRKSTRRDTSEDKGNEIMATILPGKKAASAKKSPSKDNDRSEDDIGDMVTIEDAEDLDSLEELSELEEIEETPVNEDDADEEALIEDMEEGDQVLVETVEDEEAEELEEDEEEATPASRRSGKRKESNGSFRRIGKFKIGRILLAKKASAHQNDLRDSFTVRKAATEGQFKCG